MTALEPGERFTVKYGRERTIEVVALDLRSKNRIAKLMSQTVNNPEAFELLEQALAICCPAISDDQWRTIDERAAGEIIGATMAGAALNAEEEKKSE